MYDIEVVQIDQVDRQDDSKLNFEVNINGYSYSAGISRDYYHKLSKGKITPRELVKRSFEFLLKRESPKSILKKFDLSVINKYFPEYEDEIIVK
ncbi:hypothetical protein KY385_02775 [Candidatus Parcubacteria bacterium]|nr:hypothetical protein [Candidatus Parcubacteria bacterium]